MGPRPTTWAPGPFHVGPRANHVGRRDRRLVRGLLAPVPCSLTAPQLLVLPRPLTPQPLSLLTVGPLPRTPLPGLQPTPTCAAGSHLELIYQRCHPDCVPLTNQVFLPSPSYNLEALSLCVTFNTSGNSLHVCICVSLCSLRVSLPGGGPGRLGVSPLSPHSSTGLTHTCFRSERPRILSPAPSKPLPLPQPPPHRGWGPLP